MWVWSLGWEDPLEQGMAIHSSILAWRVPWTERHGGLWSMGSQSQTRLMWLSTHTRRLWSLFYKVVPRLTECSFPSLVPSGSKVEGWRKNSQSRRWPQWWVRHSHLLLYRGSLDLDRHLSHKTPHPYLEILTLFEIIWSTCIAVFLKKKFIQQIFTENLLCIENWPKQKDG